MTSPSRDFTPKVKKVVLGRSVGLCEGCGIRPATEFHHRKFKSRGGAGVAGNCLHLCGLGNVGGCHGRAHSVDAPQGWAVASWDDPLLVPVARYDGVFFLTNDGRLVTPPNGVVLEPFAGSGTTVEACLREGFDCIAIEREPTYLPLIMQRIQKPHKQTLFA